MARVEWLPSESDHLAAEVSISKLDRFERQTGPVALSRILRKLTTTSHPDTWVMYPRFDIYRFLSQNRLRWSLKSGAELAKKRAEYKQQIYTEKLVSSDSLRKALTFCKLKPYKQMEPLLSLENRPITTKSQFISDTLKHLSITTCCSFKRSTAKEDRHKRKRSRNLCGTHYFGRCSDKCQ